MLQIITQINPAKYITENNNIKQFEHLKAKIIKYSKNCKKKLWIATR